MLSDEVLVESKQNSLGRINSSSSRNLMIIDENNFESRQSRNDTELQSPKSPGQEAPKIPFYSKRSSI